MQLVEDKTTQKDGWTDLHARADEGVKEEVLKLTEAADGSGKAKNDLQPTALHLAAMMGHAEV